jgi:thiamine-monophosphate kinase
MAFPARPKAPSALREFALIRTLHQRHGRGGASIVQGIGDDAAVVAPPRNRWSLLTTDLLAEGVHFDLRTTALPDIGFRAAAANLSDIAAMGGTPHYLLVALAIPKSGTDGQVHRLYRGIMAACRPHKVRLIGGDTSASTGGWFICITLVGAVAPRRAILRSGARAGDGLYVTGTLGDSLAGLTLLNESRRRSQRRTATWPLSPHHRQFLIRRHLRPTARITEGRWLSTHRWATSAIDLSDGLSGDLHHLCEESHVGAAVDLSAIPLSPALRAYADENRLNPVELALTGGEDYELLFTVSPRHRTRFERMAAETGIPAARIGTITSPGSGMQRIEPDGRRRPLAITSYEHFRRKP